MEGELGLRIRNSEPSDTCLREHSDVGAINSLSRRSKEKGHLFRVLGVFTCDGAHFQRECNGNKNTGKQTSGKSNQSKSWSTSEPSISGKRKSEKTKENPKDCPKEPRVRTKVPKARAKTTRRKWASHVLKT